MLVTGFYANNNHSYALETPQYFMLITMRMRKFGSSRFYFRLIWFLQQKNDLDFVPIEFKFVVHLLVRFLSSNSCCFSYFFNKKKIMFMLRMFSCWMFGGGFFVIRWWWELFESIVCVSGETCVLGGFCFFTGNVIISTSL